MNIFVCSATELVFIISLTFNRSGIPHYPYPWMKVIIISLWCLDYIWTGWLCCFYEITTKTSCGNRWQRLYVLIVSWIGLLWSLPLITAPAFVISCPPVLHNATLASFHPPVTFTFCWTETFNLLCIAE